MNFYGERMYIAPQTPVIPPRASATRLAREIVDAHQEGLFANRAQPGILVPCEIIPLVMRELADRKIPKEERPVFILGEPSPPYRDKTFVPRSANIG